MNIEHTYYEEVCRNIFNQAFALLLLIRNSSFPSKYELKGKLILVLRGASENMRHTDCLTSDMRPYR